MIKYNIGKGFRKALISVALVALPLAIDVAPTLIEQYSTVFDLTLGGLLMMVLNYAKIALKNRKSDK